MKTFFDLIQEVQKPGLCHRCGGCVTFCTAVNYGTLELDQDGKPKFGEIEKCIECGLCHAICPEVEELEEETLSLVSWSAPVGRVIETTVARASDPTVRKIATDGGVVTGLLLHLLSRGRIDGAIDAKSAGALEEFSSEDNPRFASEALEKVRNWSARKRKSSRQNRRKIMGKGINIKE